jgi:hypothetical protein
MAAIGRSSQRSAFMFPSGEVCLGVCLGACSDQVQAASITPQPFESVEFSAFGVEYVDHERPEVHQHPASVREPFDAKRGSAPGFSDCLFNCVYDGAYLAGVRSRDQHESLSYEEQRADFEHQNVSTLLVGSPGCGTSQIGPIYYRQGNRRLSGCPSRLETSSIWRIVSL